MQKWSIAECIQDENANLILLVNCGSHQLSSLFNDPIYLNMNVRLFSFQNLYGRHTHIYFPLILCKPYISELRCFRVLMLCNYMHTCLYVMQEQFRPSELPRHHHLCRSIPSESGWIINAHILFFTDGEIICDGFILAPKEFISCLSIFRSDLEPDI